MYHESNLGNFGGHVAEFSDINGYVPQTGDEHTDLTWDAATKWTPEAWKDHVADAIAATEEANQAIADWQKND